MSSTASRKSHAKARATILLLVLGGMAGIARAEQTTSGAFKIATGHASRQELCFAVAAPGAIAVRVEADGEAGPLHATLYAGQTVVHSARGNGSVEFSFTATPEHLRDGREWAVAVSALVAGEMTGRITVSHPDSARAGTHPLDTWLLARPAIGFHLVWNESGRPLPYSAWPPGMRERLWVLHDDARAGRMQPAVADPPPNAWRARPGDDPTALHTAFAPEAAREMYLSTVAHTLALETGRGVPWSLDDLNGDELDALIGAPALSGWNADQQAYEISEFDHGWAVPAPPQVAWRFLQEQRLLRSTRLETITAIVGWARRLTHVAGPVSRDNFAHHWGYAGDMPVSRALAGTRYTGTDLRTLPGYETVRHYTAGCQGTVGLLVSVLRAANIPARPRSVGSGAAAHASALFLSEDRALAHGDDPYHPLAADAAPADLLVDLATYNAWLGPRSSDPARGIGRQALTLGLTRLPAIVRRAHALDQQQGLEPAQSAVFELFRGSFTLDELREAGLWERLDSTSPGAPAAGGPAAQGWVEAETMAALVTAGATEVQTGETLTVGQWRGDRQLRWTGGRPGAELRLPFTVPADGRYRVTVRFTRAPDYAVVEVSLDDAAAALDRVNLYAPQVLAADPLAMGEHELKEGSHALRVAIVGSHPLATPLFTVGIDAVRIDRVR
ncbi:MAG: hypothetical protein IT177_00330 [Acidobacteria bacterium]|nr:hypothetical protein [Acidobacteriota bacterium]